jgi:hypothetical protein
MEHAALFVTWTRNGQTVLEHFGMGPSSEAKNLHHARRHGVRIVETVTRLLTQFGSKWTKVQSFCYHPRMPTVEQRFEVEATGKLPRYVK